MRLHAALIAIVLMICGRAAAVEKQKQVGFTPEISARIQRDTERFRKGDEVVRVVDRTGKPIAGASVEVEQLTHDFLFGCNIYMLDAYRTAEQNSRYREEFKRVFNYATLPFYWAGFEREQGKPAYERPEHMAKWCAENGITTKGHPLVWSHEAGTPAWLPLDKPDEVKRLIENRIKDIVTHYGDSIRIWDVVNESVHTRFAGMDILPYTSDPVRWARSANPKATLIVNEFAMFTDAKAKDAFLALLKQMKTAGVPYDAVGLQSHMHGGPYPISAILSVLDEYAALGKPLHLTETTVLSGGKETTPDGEKKQAEYVEQFYRACFSHPSVRAITWWDFSDAGAWQGVAAGLVRKDMSPKPAYLVLDRLINREWTTRLRRAGRTDSKGAFGFRGFGGKYRVKVTLPSGKTKTGEFHLFEGKQNGAKVSM